MLQNSLLETEINCPNTRQSDSHTSCLLRTKTSRPVEENLSFEELRGYPLRLGQRERRRAFQGSYNVQQLWNITTGFTEPPLFNLVLADEIFVMNWLTTLLLSPDLHTTFSPESGFAAPAIDCRLHPPLLLLK